MVFCESQFSTPLDKKHTINHKHFFAHIASEHLRNERHRPQDLQLTQNQLCYLNGGWEMELIRLAGLCWAKTALTPQRGSQIGFLFSEG
jgi:hypothetical protein